jgi:hypothetical protein
MWYVHPKISCHFGQDCQCEEWICYLVDRDYTTIHPRTPDHPLYNTTQKTHSLLIPAKSIIIALIVACNTSCMHYVSFAYPRWGWCWAAVWLYIRNCVALAKSRWGRRIAPWTRRSYATSCSQGRSGPGTGLGPGTGDAVDWGAAVSAQCMWCDLRLIRPPGFCDFLRHCCYTGKWWVCEGLDWAGLTCTSV